MNNTINELFDKIPNNRNILNIYNNLNDSVFNKSLPIAIGGFISIIKENTIGYIKFVDYRTSKIYIKTKVGVDWSDWFELSNKTITYATTEPTTIGANEIIFVYE